MIPIHVRYFIVNTSQRFTFVPLIALIFFSWGVQAQTHNGFDLSNASIDPKNIFRGGPPRDGIPSIDHPKFIPTEQVTFLRDNDIVIGLTRGDISRAYPLRILIWHEIVNDVIHGDAILVTYCPLCNTAMIFDRTIRGKTRTFGVSGLLYQSDVLMFDRESESLWSQLAMEAVSGTMRGTKLNLLAGEYMSWSAWRKKYPRGEVLSTDTGHTRNYEAKAYASYFSSEKTMFPVPRLRQELPNKTNVIGVLLNGQAKAYPLSTLPIDDTVKDIVGGISILVRHDPNTALVRVTDTAGKDIPSVVVFWFAWQAFYPDTALWKIEPEHLK